MKKVMAVLLTTVLLAAFAGIIVSGAETEGTAEFRDGETFDAGEEMGDEELVSQPDILETEFGTGEEEAIFDSGEAEVLYSGSNTGRTEKTVTVTAGCDDTELQEMMNLNKNGEYNLTIVIPAGTYKLWHSMFIYSNTTIRADANARLVKMGPYGAMLEAKLVDDDGGYDGCSDITVDGGIWDSTPVMDRMSGTESLRFIHCTNVTVKNAVISNVPEGSHLIVFAGSQDAAVSNCTFYGYGNSRGGQIAKEAIQLDVTHDKVVVPTYQNVTYDDLPCRNITITGCEFYHFPRAIGSHTAVPGRYHTNIIISGNEFHDLTDSAVRLYNYTDTVISNNTFRNTSTGVMAYTDISGGSWLAPNDGDEGTLPESYNITISDNTINETPRLKNGGDGIRIIGSETRPIRGIAISGNKISSCGRYGIYISGTGNCTIKGNAVGACGTMSESDIAGIFVVSSGSAEKPVRILQNTVNGKKSKGRMDGIRLNAAPYTVVSGNTIFGPSGCGVYVYQSPYCVIGSDASQYNTIQSSSEKGIYFVESTGGSALYNRVTWSHEEGIASYQSSKMVICKNRIASLNIGINLMEGSDSSVVKGNVIGYASLHGIRLYQSGNAVVSSNVIKKYGTRSGSSNGILLIGSGGSSQKAKTEVFYNSVIGYGTNKKRHCIRVSGSPYISVSGNTIKMWSASGSGIVLSDSPKSIASKNKMTITKTVYAIYLKNSGSSSITYNTISGATKKRAVVLAGSSKCTNKKNVIK